MPAPLSDLCLQLSASEGLFCDAVRSETSLAGRRRSLRGVGDGGANGVLIIDDDRVSRLGCALLRSVGLHT